MADENWERGVIEQLMRESLVERRRARRWGIAFKLTGLALLVVALMIAFAAVATREHVCLDKCTALVELRGQLDSGGRASAERVVAGLQAAFKNSGTKGVVLRINSPGGSPVQAGQIYDEVRRLRAAHPDKPLYAVVEEIAASGGYYVAAAADRIYVDKASMIGSIGVIMEGFGFAGAIEKLGVERRVVTAGSNKDFLDPFEPLDPGSAPMRSRCSMTCTSSSSPPSRQVAAIGSRTRRNSFRGSCGPAARRSNWAWRTRSAPSTASRAT